MKTLFTSVLAILLSSCATYPTIEQDKYMQSLKSNLYYPEEAKALKLEGAVKIQVGINQKGHAISLKVIQSSGSGILDTAAMRSILATRFPFPKNHPSVTVVLPINYQFSQ